jgi:hypothetical protein
MAQVEQIRQAQQTNQLRQAQMMELERERTRTNALNQAYADAFNPQTGSFDQSKLIQNLATGGLGSQIPGVQKGLREAREAELKTEKIGSEIETARFNLFEKRVKFYAKEVTELKSPLEGQEWYRQLYADPAVKREYDRRGVTLDQLIAQVPTDPAQFEQWKQRTALGADEFIKQNKPQFLTRDLGGTSEVMAVPGLGGQAGTVPGSVRRKTMTPGDEAAAQRAGGPERRLKQGERFNSETQTIEAIPGSDLFKKQKADFTKDFGAASTLAKRYETSIKKIDDLLKNEGFEDLFGGYTAYGTRLMSGKTADARTRLESLQSDFAALGKEIMSARGSSIGQITEREWPILRGLVETLDPTVDVEVARERLQEVAAKFREMAEQAVTEYNVGYGDSQFYRPLDASKLPPPTVGNTGAGGRPPPAPAAGGVDMNNPLLR